jgi:hypothetical protein
VFSFPILGVPCSLHSLVSLSTFEFFIDLTLAVIPVADCTGTPLFLRRRRLTELASGPYFVPIGEGPIFGFPFIFLQPVLVLAVLPFLVAAASFERVSLM